MTTSAGESFRQLNSKTLSRISAALQILAVAVAVTLTSGCSHSGSQTTPQAEAPYEQEDQNQPSVVSYDDYNDPLEPVNRAIFSFNDVVYRSVLTPLSKGYNRTIPPPVDQGISNFFSNIREPVNSLNNLLQGKPGKAGANLLRLGINTTIGILGIFDPAEEWWNIGTAGADFDETFSTYGAGYGIYIVFPFMGPSDLRATASRVAGSFTYPLNYIKDTEDHVTYIQIYEAFHNNSDTFEQYPSVMEPSEDPYIFMRNMYLQSKMRDADLLQNEPVGTSSGEK